VPEDDALPSFPGSQYLQLIRQRLWNDREVGRAAVMVGAGFSRNAEPRSASAPAFPLWRDLAAALGTPLGLTPAEAMGTPMTRLGSEYETSFGRQALDDLLNHSIPWQHHGPSTVHRLLLNLPWADIFTTNYDTLLEDTRADIIDRKYDLVVSPSDIPFQQRPRIVKLHGSFPSHRPFVFTEEDFRRYPHESSAFINLVQQSLMENALLLLGFSGDDLNFQSWAGWVRDRLGPEAPAIYLCGLLDHTEAARRYFDGRGIKTIDLSPLFPTEQWPNRDERNSRALEWLLLSLANGRQPDVRDWPVAPKAPQLPEASPGLPPLMPPATRPLWTEYFGHNADLADLYVDWAATHDAYPGWSVCPPEKRQRLWIASSSHLHPIFEGLTALSAPHDLLLAHTCMARLDLCLMPLFEGADEFPAIVERYRPFAELKREAGQHGPGAPLPVDPAWRRIPGQDTIGWDTLRTLWVDLVFGLLEEARHQNQTEDFERWTELLVPVIQYHPTWTARWHCEQTLFALGRLEIDRVQECLAAWPVSLTAPFWETRRAAVLAELGELRDANRVATTALSAIRSRLSTVKGDLELLSQEGWTLHLLDVLKNADAPRGTTMWLHSERLDVLAGLGADVVAVLDDTAQRALSSSWTPPHTVETVKDFDPGRVTRHSRSNNDSFGGLLHAFGLLRTMERGAVPLRCGMFVIRDEAVVKAAESLFPFAPLPSVGALIRQNGSKVKPAIERLFSRTAVVRLSQTDVIALFDTLLASTRAATKRLERSGRDVRAGENALTRNLIDMGLEVHSRIAFKLSTDQIHRSLDLATELYRSPVFAPQWLLHPSLNTLFNRVILALPPYERLTQVGALLFLPIWEERGFFAIERYNAERWPEPLNANSAWHGLTLPNHLRQKDWSSRIGELILLTRKGSALQRRVASLRLTCLFHLGVLNQGECQRFGAALWKQKDAMGLPAGTALYPFAFLDLPSPVSGQAADLIRSMALGSAVPPVVEISEDGSQYSASRADTAALTHLRTIWYASARPGKQSGGIRWTEAEAVTLFHHLIAWWDDQKRYASSEYRDVFQELVLQNAHLMLRVMDVVLSPELLSNKPEIRSEVERLLTEVRTAGVVTAELATLLFQRTGQVQAARDWYWQELLSNVPGRVTAAVGSVLQWGMTAGSGDPVMDERLVDHIIDRVAFRILPALENVLTSLHYSMRKSPEYLNEAQISRLVSGLIYLELETRIAGEQETPPDVVIPDDDKPALRGAASGLAAELYRQPAQQSRLESWRQEGMADALPEVRDAWWRTTLPTASTAE
jgi:SIR2-like domain